MAHNMIHWPLFLQQSSLLLLLVTSEMTNKRNFSYAMDTEQESCSETSKGKKIEAEGELIEVTGKNK